MRYLSASASLYSPEALKRVTEVASYRLLDGTTATRTIRRAAERVLRGSGLRFFGLPLGIPCPELFL
jgi:hypothetical protein